VSRLLALALVPYWVGTASTALVVATALYGWRL
jgi:hypothetical protein